MAAPRELDKLERQHEENPEGTAFAPLANAYRKMGDVLRALDILQGGLFHHPDYTPARIVLGRCHLDQGNDEAAEREFARVLERDEENVIALQALADIAERQARYAESEERLTALLAVDRGNEAARDQLARVTTAGAAGTPAGGEGEEEAAGVAPLGGLELPEPEEVETGAEDVEELAIVGRGIELEPIDGLAGLEPLEAAEDEEEAEAVSGEMGDEPSWDNEPLVEVEEEDGEQVGDEITAAVADLEPLAESDEPASEDSAGVAGGVLGAATPAFEETSPLDFMDTGPGGGVSEAAEAETEEEEPEPETVATETMAELYLSQGHRLEALGIYRMLAARHPDDQRLKEKVAALEDEGRRPAAPTAGRASDVAAMAPGGQSVAEFFRVLLSSKPDAEPPPSESKVTDAGAAGPDARPPEPGPVEGSVGEPTRPAHDRLLLSAVFGEDASPVPPAVRGPGDGRSAGSTGRFSFDAFFGGQRGETVQPPDIPSGRTRIEEEDLDQFQAWLQSLKG